MDQRITMVLLVDKDMLSAILRSDVAIDVSIRIMDAFVEMRHFIAGNAHLSTPSPTYREAPPVQSPPVSATHPPQRR